MKTSFLTGTLYRGVFNVWDVDNLQFVFFFQKRTTSPRLSFGRGPFSDDQLHVRRHPGQNRPEASSKSF